MPILVLLPFILFFIFFSIVVIFFLRRRAHSKYLLPDLTDIIPKDASYEFYKLEDIRAKLDLYKVAELLKSEVKSLYLVHGTFVGDDPWHLISLIEGNFAGLDSAHIKQIKLKTKKGQNYFTKDLGNFTESHNNKINSLLSSSLNIKHFTWSSGNSHYARLQGCLDLVDTLILDQENDLILVGHSHAGQVFALLTQLLNNSVLRKEILSILKSHNKERVGLKSKLLLLKKKKIKFITLGAPARYNWNIKNSDLSVCHVINHRTKEILGGEIGGAVFTKAGDYIQQWGIAGSDFRSPVEFEQRINLQLDALFGPGTNLSFLQEGIKRRRRFHNKGHHYLIDFQDDSIYPNFFKTIFGHGTYTKVENMDILLYIIYLELQKMKS